MIKAIVIAAVSLVAFAPAYAAPAASTPHQFDLNCTSANGRHHRNVSVNLDRGTYAIVGENHPQVIDRMDPVLIHLERDFVLNRQTAEYRNDDERGQCVLAPFTPQDKALF